LSHGNAQHSARARIELVAPASMCHTPGVSRMDQSPASAHGSHAVVCDPVRCTGCAACVVACADAHQVPARQARIRVVARESSPDKAPGLTMVAVAQSACDRCATVEPAAQGSLCVAACPTRALRVPLPKGARHAR
jgi:Fe-S-cluster-containing dehydrogenase component